MKSVTTVVLAAGTGKRLGGPKALLAWPSAKGKEIPIAVAHAEARLAAESSSVLVVTRKPMMKPLLGHVRPGLDLLVSDAPDELGPAGSIAAAVPRLGDAEAVIVTPVDTPPAKADTVAKLLARLAADPALLAARPVYHGRAGHPVALRPAALARYAEASPPPLRDHLRSLGAAVADVEVSDTAVLIDLNTPADVMGLLRTLPRFVVPPAPGSKPGF
ncbi:MAG: NTP transferase domain-containing protein [Minicystis sp.]